MMRPGYYPIGGEPCQSLCVDPCGTDNKRKADTALIRQLVKALEYHQAQTRPILQTAQAIQAGHARLGGPT